MAKENVEQSAEGVKTRGERWAEKLMVEDDNGLVSLLRPTGRLEIADRGGMPLDGCEPTDTFRRDLAAKIFHSWIQNEGGFEPEQNDRNIAEQSVAAADALIAELAKPRAVQS